MYAKDLCERGAVSCSRDCTAREAAELMRAQHVGDLVVVEPDSQGRPIPVGVITDRDLVVEVMAPGLDANGLRAGEIMATPCITVLEQDPIFTVIERLRRYAVRRVPVVNASGTLVGIIALDDLLAFVADELGRLSRVSLRQQLEEQRHRS